MVTEAAPGGVFVCPPEHPHGQKLRCYLHHRCRCGECRSVHLADSRQRRREQAYGTYTRAQVPAGPVREHLAWLSTHGLGLRAVAAATGISLGTLTGIRWGRPQKDGWGQSPSVSGKYATTILAVRPEAHLLLPGACVPAVGTHRRIEALMALGWSGAELTRRAGRPHGWLGRLRKAEQITAGSARQVAELYDELWTTRPSASTQAERAMVSRTLSFAARHGFAAPLAWDDIDTDPEPPPVELSEGEDFVDVVAIELAVSGHHQVYLTTEERHMAVTQLSKAGNSDGTIARMLGVARKTIERDRSLLGLSAAVGFDGLKVAS